jgi:RNA 2',3'-cyclic 3'-phosphodiesterase
MSELPERIRAFVAVSPSAEVERAIAALIEELRAPGDGIKWVRSANLHLTLKFLGPAVQAAKIAALRPELERIAAEAAPFDLASRAVGGFPNLGRPRVIWIGLEGAELLELARRVEDAAVRCGFERERRAFTAHLTIARLNSLRAFAATRRAIERVREREFGVSRIESMTLYRSRLSANGSIYEPLGVFRFATAAPAG